MAELVSTRGPNGLKWVCCLVPEALPLLLAAGKRKQKQRAEMRHRRRCESDGGRRRWKGRSWTLDKEEEGEKDEAGDVVEEGEADEQEMDKQGEGEVHKMDRRKRLSWKRVKLDS